MSAIAGSRTRVRCLGSTDHSRWTTIATKHLMKGMGNKGYSAQVLKPGSSTIEYSESVSKSLHNLQECLLPGDPGSEHGSYHFVYMNN